MNFINFVCWYVKTVAYALLIFTHCLRDCRKKLSSMTAAAKRWIVVWWCCKEKFVSFFFVFIKNAHISLSIALSDLGQITNLFFSLLFTSSSSSSALLLLRDACCHFVLLYDDYLPNMEKSLIACAFAISCDDEQTIFVTLNVVICDPTFWKKGGHDDHQPQGVWQKKLVWKEEWVKDFKIEKQVSVKYWIFDTHLVFK